MAGRAEVRAAVAAFFAPPAVDGLYDIWTAWPKRGIPWPNYLKLQPRGTMSGAVAVVHLAGDSERRGAMGGPTSGKKWIQYTVELQIILRSTKPRSEDAVDDFDAVIDAVKTRLRSDRSLGTGSTTGAGDGTIWQAGEGDAGIVGEYSDPDITTQGATEVWGSVRFDCVQYVTS